MEPWGRSCGGRADRGCCSCHAVCILSSIPCSVVRQRRYFGILHPQEQQLLAAPPVSLYRYYAKVPFALLRAAPCGVAQRNVLGHALEGAADARRRYATKADGKPSFTSHRAAWRGGGRRAHNSKVSPAHDEQENTGRWIECPPHDAGELGAVDVEEGGVGEDAVIGGGPQREVVEVLRGRRNGGGGSEGVR